MPFKQTRIQLGLCCLNTELRERNIFCSRKPIVKTVIQKGIPYLKEQCILNCEDLLRMLQWNHRNGIRVFRISSEIFPHKSNWLTPDYDLEFARHILEEIGEYAKQTGQRLTFHPGQYNIVPSPDTDTAISFIEGTHQPGDIVIRDGKYYKVTDALELSPSTFQKTRDDLDWHAEVLDMLGTTIDSVIVVHGGAMYGNKAATIERWIRNFGLLTERVRRRLVIENCEKNFNIEDCLYISKHCNIPVVFDTHHYECYNKLHPEITLKPATEYIPLILETWSRRGIKPKFHVSEQACCGPIGKHSDLIETIPDYLLEIPDKYDIDIDIMVEAKLKEQAIAKLHKRYPMLDPILKYKVR